MHATICGEWRLVRGLQGSRHTGARLLHRSHDVWEPSHAAEDLEFRRGTGTWENKKEEKLTSEDMGLLTGPHQTSFRDESSSTMRLSEGERPVLAPEYAERAPLDVMAEPDSYTRASS